MAPQVRRQKKREVSTRRAVGETVVAADRMGLSGLQSALDGPSAFQTLLQRGVAYCGALRGPCNLLPFFVGASSR